MPGNPLTDPNWATEVTDTIERVVGTVRDKTTNNIVMVARGLVFGVLGIIVGLPVLVLSLVMITRAIQSLLELGMTWERAVWSSYLIVGGICCIVGMLLMSKRRSHDV